MKGKLNMNIDLYGLSTEEGEVLQKEIWNRLKEKLPDDSLRDIFVTVIASKATNSKGLKTDSIRIQPNSDTRCSLILGIITAIPSVGTNTYISRA